MQTGDAEHGEVDAVALEAAVTQDLPALHSGEGVLDAGANSLVGAVVFLLPGRQVASLFASVWDDQAGPLVAAVGDRHGGTDGSLGSGLFPARESCRLPGKGRPTTTTRRVSASITTWWAVE